MDVGEGAVLFVLSEPLDVRGEYLKCQCEQITQIKFTKCYMKC